MLSVTNINPQQSLPVLGNGLVPETGEFDFLSYLLGLQVPETPQGGDSSTLDLAKLIGGKQEEEPNPLLDLFSKKGKQDDLLAAMAVQANAQNPIAPTPQAGLAVPMSAADQLPNQTTLQSVDNAKPEAQLVGTNEANSNKEAPRNLVRENEVKHSLPGFEKVDKQLDNAPQLSEAQNREMALNRYAPQGSAKEVKPQVRESSEFHSQLQEAQGMSQRGAVSKTDKATLEKVTEVGPSKKQVALQTDALGADAAEVANRNNVQSNLVATPELASKGEAKPMDVPEVFHKVQSMVNHGGGKMTVSLTPPDLGRVDIVVTAKGKNVEVKIESQNEAAKSALESQIGDLRHSLQSQDLHLSKVEVQVSQHETRGLENSFAAFNDSAQSQQRQFQSHLSGNDDERSPWKTTSRTNQRSGIQNVSAPAAMSRVTPTGAGRVDLRI